MPANGLNEVEEKTLAPMVIAGLRMRGKYGEAGRGFGQLYRRFGRYAAGKPMLLHFDREYKADDADFEVCVPVKKMVDASAVPGATVRELPGGKCISLLHQGPYEELGASYKRIGAYVKEKGYTVASPSREIYIKGPGMIFRGNPKKYLTEIQMLVT